MIKIDTSQGLSFDSLRQQLKEQGFKFKEDIRQDYFRQTIIVIDRLLSKGYATEEEHKSIRNKFLNDLENHLTKIEE